MECVFCTCVLPVPAEPQTSVILPGLKRMLEFFMSSNIEDDRLLSCNSCSAVRDVAAVAILDNYYAPLDFPGFLHVNKFEK